MNETGTQQRHRRSASVARASRGGWPWRVCALGVLAIAVGLGGCVMAPLPGPGGPIGPSPVAAADRDELLSMLASCHLLRVVQSDDVAVTDAVVIAGLEKYRFKVGQMIERAEQLVAEAADPLARAALRARADGACGRLAGLTGVRPGLVRFDEAGNLGTTWLVVEGEITPGFAERTIALLRRERAIGLLIRSPGGSVYEARELGRYLRANGLRAAADGLCTSACVDVLAGGSERFITANARLGIHQSKVPRQLSSHEGGQFSVATAALYLGEMGVDNNLALLAAAMPHADVYWISLEEALRTRLATKVVQQL